jgi:hypothetical protein
MAMVIGKDSTDGLRLARVYWIGLGRPQRFDTKRVMDKWAPRMETLMRRAGMSYEDFKWYLIWSTRLRDEDGANYGNDFTAQYLRNASDPMNILEKHFMEVFFNIFMEVAAKKIPLLKEKVQREQEMAHKNDAPPRVTWHDAYCGTMKEPPAWRVEAARYFTSLDERFPMLHPAPGEEMEDFVDRMFLPFSDNREWQCSKCTYNPSRSGVRNAPNPTSFSVPGMPDEVDENGNLEPIVYYYGMEERLKWCGDCYEELVADMSDDIIRHAQENAPTISDLILSWDYS